MKMIYLRDFGLPGSPRSREVQLCVNYGVRRGRRKFWLGLWNEIFLDCGYVETMTFLYTIIILKVGPLSYNIFFKKYFIWCHFSKTNTINLKLKSSILIENFYMMCHLCGF